jgi:peptidoglycan/xylan/chitin deacetylase (PgdA/CDA1 family)
VMRVGDLLARAHSLYQRGSASTFCRRERPIKTDRAIISFTFDDFPRSALLNGGGILSRLGVAGTFYVALGLLGKHAPTGVVANVRDLERAVADGHELGCHTFSHCGAWHTDPRAFENAVAMNQRALQRVLPSTRFRTLSYPISPPRPSTKRRMASWFLCCRGGGQTFNVGMADLNCLRGYFLEKSRDRIGAIKAMIDANAAARGWLILSTHDVCEEPTEFGCRTAMFEEVATYALSSGAYALPVAAAAEALFPEECLSLREAQASECS